MGNVEATKAENGHYHYHRHHDPFAKENAQEKEFQTQFRKDNQELALPTKTTVLEDSNGNHKADRGDKALRQYTIYPFDKNILAQRPKLADYYEAKGYTWVRANIDGKRVEGFVRADKLESLRGDFEGVLSLDAKQTSRYAEAIKMSSPDHRIVSSGSGTVGHHPVFKHIKRQAMAENSPRPESRKLPKANVAQQVARPKVQTPTGPAPKLAEDPGDGIIKTGRYQTTDVMFRPDNLSQKSFSRETEAVDLKLVKGLANKSKFKEALIYDIRKDDFGIDHPKERTDQFVGYAKAHGYQVTKVHGGRYLFLK